MNPQQYTTASLSDTTNHEERKVEKDETERKLQTPLTVPNGLLLSVDPPADEPPAASLRPQLHPLQKQRVDTRVTPPTIPPKHYHRTLILCFDGTGDQFDADNSNIVQLCSLLEKENRWKQMVYYQAGIGTYDSPNVTPIMSKLSKAVNMMIAADLDNHVMDGYKFLMQNYAPGDRISLFGFSRGAYTARSLAGMLYKVGLLSADNFQQVPFAYKMYSRADKDWKQSIAFKEAFCREVTIDFLGVWDTVDSVGLFSPRLPFTTTNNIVRTFRHAVSLDERRAKFKPYLWNPKDHSHEAPPSSRFTTVSQSGRRAHQLSSPKQRHSLLAPSLEWESTEDNRLSDHEERFDAESRSGYFPNWTTDVREVWFAGCHCDVGGGSVKNATPHSLARISLRWMIRECFKADTGIMFNSQRLRSVGLEPSTLFPDVVTTRPPPLAGDNHYIESHSQKKPTLWHKISTRIRPRRPSDASTSMNEKLLPESKGILSEEEEELKDALSAKYDQLKIFPLWWLLEIIPMKFRYQKKRDEWVTCFESNLAQPRIIPEESEGVMVHRSVKTRMKAEKIGRRGRRGRYLPRVEFEFGQAIWVD